MTTTRAKAMLIRAVALACLVFLRPAALHALRPNVVVVLTDDQGYADVGFQGGGRVPTPNIDALASAGVRFSSGYVSHPFCSPSRAGLLTGRYQQRFGHENNPSYEPGNDKLGLPVTEVTLAKLFQDAGYVTGLIGKWHLGAARPFYPRQRGFDEFFGFLGGGHDYFSSGPKPGAKAWDEAAPGAEYRAPLVHDDRQIELDGYLTDVLTDQATEFVRRHHQQPFFLLLSYNAPHTPYQAPDHYRERFADIEDDECRTYAAMVGAIDDGVGRVLASLRDLDLDRRTLVFFLSDNGGQILECADNTPLRGGKGSLYEGGLRVPFVASWPGRLPAGSVYEPPVSALDILPTAAAAAGIETAGVVLDGVDLLPYLKGQNLSHPHERLFWRLGGGAGWAVRQGRWKLIKHKKRRYLFDLAADLGEQHDLAASHPERVAELSTVYKSWTGYLAPPLWPNPRGEKASPAEE